MMKLVIDLNYIILSYYKLVIFQKSYSMTQLAKKIRSKATDKKLIKINRKNIR